MHESSRYNLFQKQLIRVLTIKDEIWFVNRDVCKALNYSNPSRAAEGIGDSEKALHKLKTAGGVQKMLILNEAGLQFLIRRSHKPEAKKFKRWLERDVFPPIRNSDCFSLDEVVQILDVPGFGRRDLIRFLRQEGILLADNTVKKRYIDLGYFRVMAVEYRTEEGRAQIRTVARIHKKGIAFIQRQLRIYLQNFMERSMLSYPATPGDDEAED